MRMTDKLDAETRLLAAIVYGESSTADVFEEMAALANVMVRQSKARGYNTISAFTSKEKSGIRKRLLIRCCRSASTFQF
jgi:hypothetical protein